METRMSYEKRGLLMGILLLALACTCGPIQQITDTAATLDSAAGTAAGFATEVNENMPTFQALGTEFSDVSTEMAPTLTALAQQMPELEATMTAAAGIVGGTTGGGQSGNEIRQWASSATASSEYTPDDPDWAAVEATGAPNTPECGDYRTAWASASPSGTDWLDVAYSTPVVPTRIEIHQSNAPGSITRVEVVDVAGSRTTVYEAQATSLDECPFVLVIPVSGVSAAVNHVVITLEQFGLWNEIDAVELIGVAP